MAAYKSITIHLSELPPIASPAVLGYSPGHSGISTEISEILKLFEGCGVDAGLPDPAPNEVNEQFQFRFSGCDSAVFQESLS